MSRSGVAAACLACLFAIPSASAAWTPPLLPGIAHRAGGAQLSVRCLTAGEWSGRGLPRGVVAKRRGRVVLVAERTCSVLVGYATSFPNAPKPGTRAELDVARNLVRFIAASVSARRLARAQADCRTLEAIVPALTVLGTPSKAYAVGVRTRVLVARKKLHIELEPATSCSVKLPEAAPA
jgi:hypothetical protein